MAFLDVAGSSGRVEGCCAMKIGVTGGNGFIGWHFRCFLKTLGEEVAEVRVADRQTFSSSSVLAEFLTGLDAIVHLAGVNRADDQELRDGNEKPAALLAEAIRSGKRKVTVVYASSTYAEAADNAYGKGKADAGKILLGLSADLGCRVVNMIIPHVFGEYGRPFYNSAMATFAHQITRHDELVHVQDLCELIYQSIVDETSGDLRVTGTQISVTDAVAKLTSLYETYMGKGQLPNLSDRFERNVFNALRGYIPDEERVHSPQKHVDERGWLVETVKAGTGGQCFVSTTKPGITRGNHFHRRKVERFFVLQGKAEIKLRKLFSDDVKTYQINGDAPSYVDIPTLHTHCITNVGDEELITLFWADEYYDPENPDTYFEKVE